MSFSSNPFWGAGGSNLPTQGKKLTGGARLHQYSTHTPQQTQTLSALNQGSQQVLPQAFQGLMDLLSNNSGIQSAIDAPYLTQLYNEILPEIMNRYGLSGTARSGLALQELGKGAGNLTEKLHSNRLQKYLDTIGMTDKLAGQGLQKSTETFVQPGQSHLGKGTGILNTLGNAATTFAKIKGGF